MTTKKTTVNKTKTNKKPSATKKVSQHSNAEFSKLKKEIQLLKTQKQQLILENENNIKVFQAKAKEFSTKAQLEVDKLKEQLQEKLKLDQKEMKKYGIQKIVDQLITPLLSLKKVVEFGATQSDPIIKNYTQGFSMIVDQFFQILNQNNVVQISPKKGDAFDPDMHEIFEVIKSGDIDKEKIIETKEIGFKLHDRVIKPALVVVSK